MVGWAAVAATVLGYDIYAKLTGQETMTGCWYRLRQQTRGRITLAAVTLAGVVHFWAQGWQREET